MIRSDAGVAHRLSLSARVLSAVVSQVKAKRQRKKRLWRLHNWRARAFQPTPESRLEADGCESLRGRTTLVPPARSHREPNRPNLNITRVIYGLQQPFRANAIKAGLEAKVCLPFRAQSWVLNPGWAMKYTDIAIIGGGLAGSTAAAMLGRAGISAVLIDPHPLYPPDFRVEKLSGELQVERFRRTGIAEAVLRAATHDGENWIARFGYLLDKRPSQQYGIMYDALVNAIRAEIPDTVESIYAKATSISTSAERQKVVAVERRGDFRAPGRARQWIERRPAPAARNRTPDRQRVPFHFVRIRPGAGRPAGLRLSGADLFLRAVQRPHSLSHPVSDREQDAGQPVRLSPVRRSLAAAKCAARRPRR